jgi:hypothetical protein
MSAVSAGLIEVDAAFDEIMSFCLQCRAWPDRGDAAFAAGRWAGGSAGAGLLRSHPLVPR